MCLYETLYLSPLLNDAHHYFTVTKPEISNKKRINTQTVCGCLTQTFIGPSKKETMQCTMILYFYNGKNFVMAIRIFRTISLNLATKIRINIAVHRNVSRRIVYTDGTDRYLYEHLKYLSNMKLTIATEKQKAECDLQ